jgi:hypothetical protein
MHYFYMNYLTHDKGSSTTFLALDKTLKNRTYMYILDYFPENQSDINDTNVYFDNEWIAITKVFNEYMPLRNSIFNFSNFFIEKQLYNEYLYDMHEFNFRNQKHNQVLPANNFIEELVKSKEIYKDKKVIFEFYYSLAGNIWLERIRGKVY